MLGSADWEETLEALIEEHRPQLIIIDTATSACNITDENHNGEAHQVVNILRLLMTQAKAGCLVLKHAKIDKLDGEFTTRGAKAWEGAPDGVWYLKRPAGRPYANGWADLLLTPKKSRAFGLRHSIRIIPHEVRTLTGELVGHSLEARKVHRAKSHSEFEEVDE